jgi:hypothetical protein
MSSTRQTRIDESVCGDGAREVADADDDAECDEETAGRVGG